MSTLVNVSNDELARLISDRARRLVNLVGVASSSMDNEVSSEEIEAAIAMLQDALVSLQYGSGSLLAQLRKAEAEANARFDSLVAADVVPVFEEPDQAFIDRFEKVEA